ncbi:MAG TPA: hypothetical protein VFH99_02760 [Candidatus Saccharimonadales bacterium]|nr:hypothetical protein [Candidatus Saccharimonadales bacterium]
MKGLEELSRKAQVETGVFVHELGAFVIDETTRLVLREPIELGWVLEKSAAVVPLPAPAHALEPMAA